MNFCPNCGAKLQPQAKFCVECGTKTNEVYSESINDNREVRNDPLGTTTSCPYCGSPLNSFSSSCPGCGREVIHNEYATACQRLCDQLERIERSRPVESVLSTITGLIDRATDSIRLKPTDQQKVDAISSFVVPNTKADILEFLMLSESKMEAYSYSKNSYENTVNRRLDDAWEAKHDQVMSKAELILGSDPDFKKIRDAFRAKSYKRHRKCQYCGGEFKGVFNEKCVKCGRLKDY